MWLIFGGKDFIFCISICEFLVVSAQLFYEFSMHINDTYDNND